MTTPAAPEGSRSVRDEDAFDVAAVTSWLQDNASEADRASVQALLRLTLALLGPSRKENASG